MKNRAGQPRCWAQPGTEIWNMQKEVDQRWNVRGPNSGGGEEYFFAQGRLWHRRYGSHGDVSEPLDSQAFIDQYWPQRVGHGRRHGRIIRWLVANGQGHLPPAPSE